MIEIKNLSKRFASFTAVDDLVLSIKKGEIFAFLGTNGAGKTTTIKMLTGVLRPSSGTAIIGGYDIRKKPLQAKYLMGIVPDRPYLYGKLTASEFLFFIADLYHLGRQKAKQKIDEVLELFELAERRNDLVDSFSHGMKQRLLMCAAQLHDPAILVIDEPMVGLDPRGAKLLKNTLRQRAKDGLTIFMSTHSLSVAEEIADVFAIINKGQIIAKGTKGELFQKANKTLGKAEESGASCGDLEGAFLQLIEADDFKATP